MATGHDRTAALGWAADGEGDVREQAGLSHDLPQRVRRPGGDLPSPALHRGVYLAIGLLVVCLAPGLAERVRTGLREETGVTQETAV